MTTKKVKIFFFGTPSIGVPTLKALFQDDRFIVVGVGVFPDKPIGRKQILTPCPIKIEASSLGLDIFDISNRQDITDCLELTRPDLALVIAFGFLFRKNHLEQLPFGMINVHFSLLPLYRGASPVQSALLHGDLTSGITWQKMVSKLDAGPIIDQKEYVIPSQSTTEDLFRDYGEKTAELTGDILWKYAQNKIVPVDQDESKVSFCSKFEKSDGLVDIKTQTAEEIFRRWKAFQPWPGITLKDSGIKLLKISLTPISQSLTLETAQDTKLYVQELQIPGKKPMAALDAWRGNSESLTAFQTE